MGEAYNQALFNQMHEIEKLRAEIERLRATLQTAWHAMRHAADDSGILWFEVEEVAAALGVDAITGKPKTEE